MSKRINVNPGQYKVAGRERQGEELVPSEEKQAFAQQRAEADRWRAKPEEISASASEQKARAIRIERLPAKKASSEAVAKPALRKKAKAVRVTAKASAGKGKAPVRKAAAATKRRKS